MKDMLGVTVEVGDVIVSASGQGRHKVGKVYAFSATGLPMIQSLEDRYDTDARKYVPKWAKVSSGWSVLILGRDSGHGMSITPEVAHAITREYPE